MCAKARDEVAPLAGLRFVSFESRRGDELAEMLRRRGADVIRAPALRELPLAESSAAGDLFLRLESGTIDVLLLLTGVGTRAMVAAVSDRYSTDQIRALLGGVALVARGPKPIAALRALGLVPAVVVPEPNTWRELLAALDRELPVGGRRVAVQEYGAANPQLIAGLEARGAEVMRVPVYRWALPLDTGPLREAAARLAAGEADVALFTSATQIDHLLLIAAEVPGREAAVIAALRERVVVAAIGPVCRAALAQRGIEPELVPEHAKLGPLVAALAEHGARLVAAKTARNL
ncbi:MAG TPA: uroporphyrinogen-III synthase [Candidatus Bathyarchaeia archaeon]|nr:uroporphyrinogen-III synthase [Candidatus Bathyarchaeia archaeon]